MARKVNLKLREEWRQRVKRQRQSGLTVADFCRREGVSSAAFYLWRQKLQGKSRSTSKRKAAQKPATIRASAVEPVPKVPSESAFVQLPVPRANTSPWIELVLAEGTIIRVPQQNLTALETVLRALGSVSRSPLQGETRHA
jgi:putative transposase